MKKRTLTMMFILVMGIAGYAQPVLIAPDITANPNETIKVDINVEEFDSLVTLLFSLRWDENIIRYDSVSNMNIPGLTMGYFGISGDSVLTLAWDDASLLGVTLPSDMPIFSINYTVVGSDDSTSPLAFQDPPTVGTFMEAVQIQNGNFVEVNLGTENGSVTVDATTSAVQNDANEIVGLELNPNPFNDFATLTFTLNKAGEVDFRIQDESGRLVFSRKETLTTGIHSKVISRDILKQPGIYFYTLQTLQNQRTGRMILTE